LNFEAEGTSVNQTEITVGNEAGNPGTGEQTFDQVGFQGVLDFRKCPPLGLGRHDLSLLFPQETVDEKTACPGETDGVGS
jgi:hypothetical protein